MGNLPSTPPRVMRGANGSVAGASGYPPIPAAADNVKYLKGDGTWSALSNASAATNAEASAGTSTTTFVTPANAGIAAAGARNALATRGGVAFDGTSGSRVYTALTSQNIGTDSFSVSLIVDMPTSNPTTDRGVFYVGPSSGQNNVARTMYLEFKTAGELALGILGATTSDVRSASWNGFRASYSGKRIHLLLVRDSATSTIALYVNGVVATPSTNALASGSDPTWAGLVTSNFFQLGNNAAAAQVWDRCIYSASLYNCALTQADVTEIYELGGAVPERFKFGSQAGLITGDNSTFASDTGFWARTAGVTISGGKLVFSGAATGDYLRRTLILTVGKKYRIGYTISGRSAGVLGAYDGVAYFDSKNADGAYSVDFTAAGSSVFFINFSGQSPSFIGNLDDVTLVQVGAVCHLRLSDGIGRVLRDTSTNKLHALRTATGVSDVIELDDGLYPQLALTANGELLDTAGVLRTDAVLVDVVVKNTTANAVTAFGIGMSSGVRNLTYETNIPANSTVILPINRSDLAGLTVGTAPYGRVYYSAASWNSGSLNLSIRYRRERDL